MCITLSFWFLALLFVLCVANGNNPVPTNKAVTRIIKGTPYESSVHLVSYPISASWFKDRFSTEEWDQALKEFQSIGGDTVWLRAPPVLIQSKEQILADPNFAWCRSYKSSSGTTGTDCVTETESELHALNITIKGFATYQYEEDFNKNIMLCPNVDRKYNSSRVYYRLILPLSAPASDLCQVVGGSEVLVLFTSFAGTDPHQLLLNSAHLRNMSVYFGLPSVGSMKTQHLPAYYHLVYRILNEHKSRYSGLHSHVSGANEVLATLKGYYSTDEVCLATVSHDNTLYIDLYSRLGSLVHKFGKIFAISPYIDLNKSQGNWSIGEHVRGFEKLASTKQIDVLAVQEGRGCSKGAYFWDNEKDVAIAVVDPVLDKIVRYLDPAVKVNVTFNEQFTGSNNKLFKYFRDSRDRLVDSGIQFEYWLNIEAFEYLRDDPCLPVDRAGSGMAELLDRTTKLRIDKALTVAGAQPEKIISFAWDSDFTCKGRNDDWSLAETIKQDGNRPIIANCSWHSPYNMSIVVIGYNLMGLMQTFTVDYPRVQGDRKRETLYGYYYEADYGLANRRVHSLVYIQLFDVMEPVYIAPHGTVTVTANTAYHPCVFEY